LSSHLTGLCGTQDADDLPEDKKIKELSLLLMK
jgi:hypothetical protein